MRTRKTPEQLGGNPASSAARIQNVLITAEPQRLESPDYLQRPAKLGIREAMVSRGIPFPNHNSNGRQRLVKVGQDVLRIFNAD